MAETSIIDDDPFLSGQPFYPIGRPGSPDPNADPTAGLPAGYRYIGFEGAIADANNVVVYEPSQGWVGPGPAPAWVAGLPQVGIANVNPVTNLAPVAPTPPVAGAMAPQMPQQPARRPLGVLEDQGGDADGSRGAPGGGGPGAPISSTIGSADYFAGDPAEELGGNPADPSNFWGALEGIDVGSMLAKGFGKAVSYGLQQIPVVGDILSGGAALWDAIGGPPWQTDPEENRLAAARSAGTSPGALPGAGPVQAGFDRAGYAAAEAGRIADRISADPQNIGFNADYARYLQENPELEEAPYYDSSIYLGASPYRNITGRPTNYLATAPGAAMTLQDIPNVPNVSAGARAMGPSYMPDSAVSRSDPRRDPDFLAAEGFTPYEGGPIGRGFSNMAEFRAALASDSPHDLPTDGGGPTAGFAPPSESYDWYGGGDPMGDLGYAPSPVSYDMGGYEGDSEIGSAGPDVSAEDYDWYGGGDQEGGGGGDYADDYGFSGYADEDSDPGDQYGV